MIETEGAPVEESTGNTRLAVLLAMAMFVLVVDTSLMNVSISAVVARPRHDGERRPVGDRARGARLRRVHPDRQQDRRPDRAQAGVRARPARLRDRRARDGPRPEPRRRSSSSGRSSAASAPSLLLPAMQSLIHGNFEGAAQRKAYALVGAAGRDRRRRRPAARRLHHDLPLLADRLPLRGRDHRGRARPGSGSCKDVPYTGDRAGRRRRRGPLRRSGWAASCSASSSGRRAARRSARCSRSASSRSARSPGGSHAASARASRR